MVVFLILEIVWIPQDMKIPWFSNRGFNRLLCGSHLLASTRANYTIKNREEQDLTALAPPILESVQSNKTGAMAPKPILAAVSY